MENNNHKKRKVMLIAAFAVAVIALAGVGYAVTGYKATTVNYDNTATGKYITVTQTQDTAYEHTFNADNVLFHTYTDASHELYTIAGTTTPLTVASTDDYTGIQIGDTINMTISGETSNAYNIDVKVSSGNLNGRTGSGAWVYLLEFAAAGSTPKYMIADSTGVFATGITQFVPQASGDDQIFTVKLYIATLSTSIFESIITDATAQTFPDYYGKPTSSVCPLDSYKKALDNVGLIFTIEGNTTS